MSQIKQRTEEDEKKVNDEYAPLLDRFRVKFGDVDSIRLAQKMGRVRGDEKLLEKHEGKKMENVYKKKVYDGKVSLIGQLNYYFKNNNDA